MNVSVLQFIDWLRLISLLLSTIVIYLLLSATKDIDSEQDATMWTTADPSFSRMINCTDNPSWTPMEWKSEMETLYKPHLVSMSFGFLLKYFIPTILWVLFFTTFKNNVNDGLVAVIKTQIRYSQPETERDICSTYVHNVYIHYVHMYYICLFLSDISNSTLS